MLIGELLWEGQATFGFHIMRCKGVFVDFETKEAHMLQGVEDLFEFRPIAEKENVVTRFLFVVQGKVDPEMIKTLIISRCSTI